MITIYTLPNCSRCEHLKTYLREIQVTYETMEPDAEIVTACLIEKGHPLMDMPCMKVGSYVYLKEDLFMGEELNREKVRYIFALGKEDK
jgi:glutaredoxin